VLLLGKGLQVQFVRTQNTPFIVGNELLKGAWVVDKVVQVTQTLLTYSKSYFENVRGD
jgi:hypothetical protein